METAAQRTWVSYREASEIAGLSRTTLWKLISAGHVRAAKVGKAVRINRQSLEEYMEGQDYSEIVRQ